ncbi:unnamed protein product, partial [marine sediment metagenome]
TGAAIDNIGNQGGAGSGAANRDGTLVAGAWSSIWEVDATPVVPQSLGFDGTFVDCGSAADIDDLHGADFTAEMWVRENVKGETEVFIEKGNIGAGWYIREITSTIFAIINLDDTDASLDFTEAYSPNGDKIWHHVAITWDFSELTLEGFYDGISVGTDVGVGNPVTDAAVNLYLGARGGASQKLQGAMGWTRISDTIRYTANFVPDGRTNPPAADGNTIRQFNFTDGAGLTLTDATATANGTITMGAGQWNNTPDMEIDEPGAAIYGPKGYNLGSDAANDGMYIEQVVVAETDYVVFPNLSIGESGRARPRIRVEDVTGAADVVIFNGPMLYGQHTGANGSATLIPTAPRWIADALIGATYYNITDGSSAVITDNTEGVATGVLAGGTDDDWDTNDFFVIMFPRGYCER